MLPPTRPIIDTGRYEAFPVACRTSDGTLVMAWASSDQHYATTSDAKLVTSPDGGLTWTAPRIIAAGDATVPRWSAVGLATLAGRVALMTMRPTPYSGYIQVTSDLTTWPTRKPVSWSSSTWTFPSDLAWLDTGTPDGLMLACCYGSLGIEVTASTNAGTTWTRRGIAMPAPHTEATITQLPSGELLMLARYESGSAREIRAARSGDLGVTWSAPVTILTRASGLPRCTVMPDGTLIATIRDMSLDDSPESWAIATSTDSGHSWRRAQLSDAWMMYGDIVATSPTTGLLIGANQDRKSATNADIWSLGLELRDPADAPIRIRDTVGTICLTVPAGATVSGTATIRYPPRTYVGTPTVRARLVQPVDGATVRIITVTPSDFTVRVVLAAPATTTTYIPALWSAEGGVQSWATN